MKKTAMDEHTTRYIEFLRKRSELELQLFSEHAPGDPGDRKPSPKAARERKEAARELMEMRAESNESGEAPARMPWPAALPAYEVGGELVPRSPVTCDFDLKLRIEEAEYCEGLAWGDFDRAEIPPKGAKARTDDDAQAGSPSHVGVCYDTDVDVPAADGVTSVGVTSEVEAEFKLLHASATGSGIATVSAATHLIVLGSFGVQSASGAFMVRETVSNATFTLGNLPNTTMKPVIRMTISVPPGAGETLQVREIVTLEVHGAGGEAHIGGEFTWSPLGVRMIEGCRLTHPQLLP